MMSFTRAALALGLLFPAPLDVAFAQASKERAVGFGNFGSSKEPIKIDANKLDVFDKEGRAVFTGDVVAVQGESTMKCTIMTVFYEQRDQNGGQAAPSTQTADDSAIKKIDCKGPVTIVSRTQVATGENATFDRGSNKIMLTGNATLSDGPNVTKGERVLYDINTGVANIETTPGGRVRALFVPGQGGPAPTGAGGGASPAPKPKPQQRPATN
ncbi:organic solvent tolerance protein OstA [Microvirga terrae]|uniref:Organic solvent tolerance protein OstA n=1 Tax=Microvirga terrae TaxID=2740529 RepID=A0ABY5RTQ6_9HYPH|nr:MULTISPECIES: LptA/OstA family protein [Microvirga]MBQ0819234.1 organic solvent tolerance protein OstA [Microvirga sp. HBU67558]UVF19699.1 organic solvent tolerance protein OstA [Microvirga terrae]